MHKGVHVLFGEQAVVTGERRVATGELRSEKRLRSGPLRGIGLHSSQIGTRVASLSGAVLAAKLKDFARRKCRPPALNAYLRCGRCCGTTGLWRAVIA